MNNQGNKHELSGVFIGLGVLLIVLGALFFVGQAVCFDLGRFGWPLGLVIVGILLLVGGLLYRRKASR